VAGPTNDDRVNLLSQEYGRSDDPEWRAGLTREASRLGYTAPLDGSVGKPWERYAAGNASPSPSPIDADPNAERGGSTNAAPFRVEVRGTSADEDKPANEDTSVRASIMKALETLGEPFANFSERTADAIRHPGDTASNIGAGLLGGVASLGNIVAAPGTLAYDKYKGQPLGTTYKANAAQIRGDVEPLAADPSSLAYSLSHATPGAIALSPLGAAGGFTGFGLDVAANAGLSAAEAYGEGRDPASAAKWGAGGSVLGRTLARLMRGAPTSEGTRELLRGDVVPTPGALGGPILRAAENAGTVLPGVGDVINYSRGSVLKQAARAEINRATAPVGTTVGRSGASAVDEANAAVSSAYNAAKPGVSLSVNDAAHAVTDSMQGWSAIPGMTPQHEQWLARFVKEQVLSRMGNAAGANRGMTGEEFKALDSLLSEQAFKFSNAADPLQHPLGKALYDIKDKLYGRASGPGVEALRNADSAFSNMRAVTAAADRAPGGHFTPQQLHRQGVNSPFNTAARELPTPSGGLVDTIRGTTALGVFLTGHLGWGAAAATAVAGSLYSKPGVNLILNGIPSSVPYAWKRYVSGLSPAQAMSEIADKAAKYPQIGNAVSATLSRYGADYAARRQQPEGATQ